jgi:outer membrane protein OmpA-like peptidoglycan-associated protein
VLRRCSGLIIVGLLVLGYASPGAGQPLPRLEIAAGVDSPWQFVSSGSFCHLEQQLGGYGVARFLGTPGQPMRFELIGHRDLFAEGPVEVVQSAPAWHPQHPSERPLGEALHVSRAGIAAADPVATRMLVALKQGYDLQLRRAAWYAQGQDVVVRLSGTGAPGRYREFTACCSGPVLRSWAEVERTRIGFSSSAADLDDAAREQLSMLADYLRSDRSVVAVYIDGHTDDVGSATSNIRLARQRAEALADFFTNAGVDPELIKVRYHGARYPVADNDSEAGRAANRRATIRLERNWSQVVAR